MNIGIIRSKNYLVIKQFFYFLFGYFFIWLAIGNIAAELVIQLFNYGIFNCSLNKENEYIAVFNLFIINCKNSVLSATLNIALGIPRILISFIYLIIANIIASLVYLNFQYIIASIKWLLPGILVFAAMVCGYLFWHKKNKLLSFFLALILVIIIVFNAIIIQKFIY